MGCADAAAALSAGSLCDGQWGGGTDEGADGSGGASQYLMYLRSVSGLFWYLSLAHRRAQVIWPALRVTVRPYSRVANKSVVLIGLYPCRFYGPGRGRQVVCAVQTDAGKYPAGVRRCIEYSNRVGVGSVHRFRACTVTVSLALAGGMLPRTLRKVDQSSWYSFSLMTRGWYCILYSVPLGWDESGDLYVIRQVLGDRQEHTHISQRLYSRDAEEY